MSCSQRNLNQEGWWSTKPISVKEGALFQLHPYMQKSCFLQFTGAMTYTKKALLSFEDKFHGICQMLLLFNKQYEDSYSLSWMNCLDESISSWLNQHCPGFMYIPCKPHPRGNKYHLIADRDQGKSIMWQVKLQEGKHHPRLTFGQALINKRGRFCLKHVPGNQIDEYMKNYWICHNIESEH
ncbi:hypothetical protein ACHAXS_000194 [Conticribra weissflogii]